MTGKPTVRNKLTLRPVPQLRCSPTERARRVQLDQRIADLVVKGEQDVAISLAVRVNVSLVRERIKEMVRAARRPGMIEERMVQTARIDARGTREQAHEPECAIAPVGEVMDGMAGRFFEDDPGEACRPHRPLGGHSSGPTVAHNRTLGGVSM